MTRRRTYSLVSIDEQISQNSKSATVKYLKEKIVFRPVPADPDEDNYHSFLLEDVAIYKGDGTSIGNLLNAELHGSYLVRGKLAITEDDDEGLAYLKNPRYNGEYIEIRTQAFSIAPDPTILWARGENRWFEVRPSEAYRAMYAHMVVGIEIYFGISWIYERASKGKNGKKKVGTLAVEEIMRKFSFIDGNGVTLEECPERIKAHAEFLLSQMSKGGRVKWLTTKFFAWLAAECPETYKALRKKSSGDMPINLEPVNFNVRSLPKELPQVPEDERIRTGLRPTSSTIAAASRTRSSKLPPPIMESSAIQHSLPVDSHAGSILSVIYNAIEDTANKITLQNITFSKVVQLVNYNFTVRSKLYPDLSDHNFCKAIVAYYSPQLSAALGKEFSQSQLSRELKVAIFPDKIPALTGKRDSDAFVLKEIKTLKLVRRKQRFLKDEDSKASRTTSFDRKDERKAFGTPSHSSKTIIPPLSTGRRSGKQAALRLASTPAKRDSSVMQDLENQEFTQGDDVSSAADGGRAAKRRRESPADFIEMGDDENDSELQTISRSSSSSYGISHQTSVLSLVSTPLPKTTPNGPNGAWVCHYANKGCSFVVRDAESESGKDTIYSHLLEHAGGIVKEQLVEQEASLVGRNFDASHLVERLRAYGEANRPVEPALVKPIKRALR